MDTTLKKMYLIHATPTRVWEALTNPDLIKEYYFNTNATSDWKTGSEITWTGVWEGQEYLDKGKIIHLEPEKKLTFTHWSSRSGLPDKPENYSWYSYELQLNGHTTELTVVQENKLGAPNSEKAWEHWDKAMNGLKNLVEKQPA
ncbi:MAG TPA: SRPBCC domain-containing protein [Flavobacteriales bacterium]|nr:SRPBCC domain-containing protein [Flavobacteriales bacterium]